MPNQTVQFKRSGLFRGPAIATGYPFYFRGERCCLYVPPKDRTFRYVTIYRHATGRTAGDIHEAPLAQLYGDATTWLTYVYRYGPYAIEHPVINNVEPCDRAAWAAAKLLHSYS